MKLIQFSISQVTIEDLNLHERKWMDEELAKKKSHLDIGQLRLCKRWSSGLGLSAGSERGSRQ